MLLKSKKIVVRFEKLFRKMWEFKKLLETLFLLERFWESTMHFKCEKTKLGGFQLYLTIN